MNRFLHLQSPFPDDSSPHTPSSRLFLSILHIEAYPYGPVAPTPAFCMPCRDRWIKGACSARSYTSFSLPKIFRWGQEVFGTSGTRYIKLTRDYHGDTGRAWHHFVISVCRRCCVSTLSGAWPRFFPLGKDHLCNDPNKIIPVPLLAHRHHFGGGCLPL